MEPIKKHVACVSFGGRVRIAKLHSNHEELLYKIIKVAGWARSVRDGKDFCFIALSDGSCQKDLQVVVDKCIDGYEEIAKGNVGTSF